MRFVSTNGHSGGVAFREAALRGLAPDGGLWMMEAIPVLPPTFFQALPSLSPQEIAGTIATALLGDDLSGEELSRIITSSLTFPIPLVPLDERTAMLELFHGPTLAFKDVGARFMAQVLGILAEREQRSLTVLVATSGDTGGAVAHAFHGVAGITVYVLYPRGRVSDRQERQFTTLGGNITALAVEGSFDDCQHLVKEAFRDTDLTSRYWLTSANSINVARLIPQTFYYFFAVAQVPQAHVPIVVSIPSGNFGNLTAGVIAKRMGLPIARFVAATNRNDVVPEFLATGTFRPRPSIPTASNAMDVGNPSNFARLSELYGGSVERMREEITGYTFSDGETRDCIAQVERSDHYLLDPHSAVGLLGLRAYAKNHPAPLYGISLATAHPAKFPAFVESATKKPVAVPKLLQELEDRPTQSFPIPPVLSALRAVLDERT